MDRASIAAAPMTPPVKGPLQGGPDLTESLDVQTFTALSPGIGLGELRPAAGLPQRDAYGVRMRTPVAPSPARPFLSSQTEGTNPVHKAWSDLPAVAHAGAVSSGKGRLAKAKRTPAPASRTFSRCILAWGIDFLFVAVSLAAALALAELLVAIRTGETGSWLALAPMQWLAGQSPVTVVGGVYGMFAAYTLLFKLLAGRTFGESLLGLSGGWLLKRAPR